MAIHGVSHVAVGVSDMERSLVFYRDVIGLHVSADQIEEFPSIGDAPPIKRRGVYLRRREGPHEPFIVLDQRLDQEPFGEPATIFQVGVHHYGFWVDDVDEIVARAQEQGFPVMSPPGNTDSRDYGEPPGSRLRSAFLRDADGNVVQLDQRL